MTNKLPLTPSGVEITETLSVFFFTFLAKTFSPSLFLITSLVIVLSLLPSTPNPLTTFPLCYSSLFCLTLSLSRSSLPRSTSLSPALPVEPIINNQYQAGSLVGRNLKPVQGFSSICEGSYSTLGKRSNSWWRCGPLLGTAYASWLATCILALTAAGLLHDLHDLLHIRLGHLHNLLHTLLHLWYLLWQLLLLYDIIQSSLVFLIINSISSIR